MGGMNFQLIFTTHSPYMLSDIKPGNVIMMKKIKKTGYSEGKSFYKITLRLRISKKS